MPRIASLFSTAERGGGAPVELYTFQRSTSVWRYTSADTTQTVSGVAFTPAAITRGNLEQKPDTGGIQFTITVSLGTPFGDALLVQGNDPVVVTVQRNQTGASPVFPVLMGKTLSVKFTDDTAELTVATVERDFKTLIPRVPIQRTCPWTIYSSSCGVDKTAFDTVTTIAAITVNAGSYVLTLADDAADGYWTNGLILLDAGGAPLFVAAHTGFNVTIWGQVPAGLAVSDGLTIYAGCDKQRSTCLTKFSNLDNFGGFADMPAKDPKLTKLDKSFAPGAIP